MVDHLATPPRSSFDVVFSSVLFLNCFFFFFFESKKAGIQVLFYFCDLIQFANAHNTATSNVQSKATTACQQ